MENWLYAELSVLIEVILSLLAIFTVIIIITRIAGLRTFAKMSSFDFASTIAIGSILASVIMSNDNSLLKGATALVGIVLFQTTFSFVVRKSNFFKNLATNDPLLLMKDGEILYNNLKKANVGEGDLIAKLREANVLDFSEVHAVILESTGDMSVLHGNDDVKLSDKLLKGVRN